MAIRAAQRAVAATLWWDSVSVCGQGEVHGREMLVFKGPAT